MPVVIIRTADRNDHTTMQATLDLVVHRLAEAIGSVPSNVWAHFSSMDAMQEGAGAPDPATYHPVVTVLADPRPDDQIHRGLRAVAEAVATGTGISLERIWVHWVDLPPSRTFSRGHIR